MQGLFGGLPPGLRGYVAAEEMANQRGMNQLGMTTGLLGLQNALETQPLQRALLQTQVANALQNYQLRQGLLGEAAAAPQTALAAGAVQGDVGPTVTNAARIPQMGGGGSFGVSPQIQSMLLSGDTGMIALAKSLLEQQKPIVGREGAPVLTRDASGALKVDFYAPKTEAGTMLNFGPGGVTGASQIPGYAPAISGLRGSITGAEEAAKAPYQPPIETVGSKGEKIFTPRPAYAAPFLNQGTPAAPTVPGISAGFPGAAAPRPGGVSTGMTAEDAAAAAARGQERAKAGAEFESKILEGGRVGRTNLTQLQILAPNLDKLPTGPIFPLLASGAAYFKQFGIDVNNLSKNLDAAQASDAILKQLALKVRDPSGGGGMPGALSDKDREFLADSIPSLSKVPDGNRKLIEIMMALEQRKIDEAAIVNRMQADRKSTNEIRDALMQFGNSRRLLAQ